MNDWQPKITAFLCNWCSYGAADLAGVSRLQYPPNIRVIRVPCSARVSPKFILAAFRHGADVLAAFRHGADGVWVSG
ncbi:MAG: hydrogenase iron-sulfur subunit [Deltaproteobacteria bacterium]|nr:hydrogenase iron-sulfur subunit [Deltaproteobacteria bacterium]